MARGKQRRLNPRRGQSGESGGGSAPSPSTQFLELEGAAETGVLLLETGDRLELE
jgi:hypothetical protein